VALDRHFVHTPQFNTVPIFEAIILSWHFINLSLIGFPTAFFSVNMKSTPKNCSQKLKYKAGRTMSGAKVHLLEGK